MVHKRDKKRPEHKSSYKKEFREKIQPPEYPSLKEENSARKKKDHFIRLNKYIANAGICSRREADQLIKSGQIKINGKVIKELGTRILPSDKVEYRGRVLNREKLVYILINKPKDHITTTKDPGNRKTVMNLVHRNLEQRVYPVGRLDRNTTGLLLMTNDGELAERLSHPSYNIRKIYEVKLDKPLTDTDLNAIKRGIEVDDGLVKVDDIAVVSEDKKSIGVEIHSGRNRIVRRIFEHFGYHVTALDRVMYAFLTKKDLPRGKWRFLKNHEVIKLKHLGTGGKYR